MKIHLVYFQVGYENFTELKEEIIREVEKATARGQLVRSARRFVEELSNSSVPYAKRVEYLLGQVRLAQAMREQNWLRRAAEVAMDRGFMNLTWICDHICLIPPHRGSNRSKSSQVADINENYSTAPDRDYGLQVDQSIQLQMSEAQSDSSPPITGEEDDMLAWSSDISIGEPVEDESDSIVHSISTPSTEEASSEDDKATGWQLISAAKQLFRVPAEEVSHTCGGRRDPSPEPKGRRSRGHQHRADRRMSRQEAPVSQTMQPRREENRRGRQDIPGCLMIQSCREENRRGRQDIPGCLMIQSCREVIYKRRQEAPVIQTIRPRCEEVRKRQEARVIRAVQPRRKELNKTWDASMGKMIRPICDEFYRSRSSTDSEHIVEARGPGKTIQLPAQTTTKERFMGVDCPIPDCNGEFVRAHCLEAHLPPVFYDELSGEDITNRRLGVLRSITRLLLGIRQSLSDLIGYLEAQGLLNLVDAVFTPCQRLAMSEFGIVTGYDVPDRITILMTGNSPALLTHWAVVSLLFSALEPHQRSALRDQFPLTGRERNSLLDIPDGFDTCCQYDKLAHEVGYNLGSDPRLVFAQARAEPGFEVNLKSALLVFSNPDCYPSKDQIRQFRARGFHVSLGARPKCDISEAQLDRLADLLEMPEVAALGEIGVDHSVPIQYWARQTVNMQRLLGCLSTRAHKILVVKCRGMVGQDPSEAYDILRTCLHQFLSDVQLIHLHCFDGDSDVVNRWLQSFPFTYFSFARVVDTFEEGQREALRNLDDARLLLETNSPFIKFGGSRASTPAQIGMAARAVAAIRGGTWRSILAVATRNARRLYEERMEPQCDWSNTQRTPFAHRH